MLCTEHLDQLQFYLESIFLVSLTASRWCSEQQYGQTTCLWFIARASWGEDYWLSIRNGFNIMPFHFLFLVLGTGPRFWCRLAKSSASTSCPLVFILSQGPTQLLKQALNLYSSCLSLLNIWDYGFSLAGMVVPTWPCSAVSLKESISPFQNGFDHL